MDALDAKGYGYQADKRTVSDLIQFVLLSTMLKDADDLKRVLRSSAKMV